MTLHGKGTGQVEARRTLPAASFLVDETNGVGHFVSTNRAELPMAIPCKPLESLSIRSHKCRKVAMEIVVWRLNSGWSPSRFSQRAFLVSSRLQSLEPRLSLRSYGRLHGKGRLGQLGKGVHYHSRPTRSENRRPDAVLTHQVETTVFRRLRRTTSSPELLMEIAIGNSVQAVGCIEEFAYHSAEG